MTDQKIPMIIAMVSALLAMIAITFALSANSKASPKSALESDIIVPTPISYTIHRAEHCDEVVSFEAAGITCVRSTSCSGGVAQDCWPTYMTINPNSRD